jgi:hypothetical protein
MKKKLDKLICMVYIKISSEKGDIMIKYFLTSILFWALITSMLYVTFQLGIHQDRQDIRRTIISQHIGTRLIKVPQLKMTLIPFEKGFISDWDAKKEGK